MSKQRLALTWFNQDKSVLPLPEGGFEWVERDDPRMTEVRLLEALDSVGETTGTAADNLLIVGDAYDALHALTSIPEYSEEYKGKVKVVYIDPPFNTEQTFGEFYDDNFDHSIWLGLFRDRVKKLHELLAEDGSIWVHLDDAEVHRARLVLDEVFGINNFVAEIIWEKADSPNSSATYLSKDQDYILLYAKKKEIWRPNRMPRSAAVDAKYTNPDGDPRGRWFGDNFSASKPYSKGTYPITTPSGRVIPGPPAGAYWRYSEDRLKELDADNRIWWGPEGNDNPKFKRFLDQVAQLVPRTFWSKKEVGSNRTAKSEIKALFKGRSPFATPKPERLLQRVIHVASNPGDIVVDCYAGSGTTAAVAHKMGRRWITVEAIPSTVENFTAPRLVKVVKGIDKGGATSTTERVAADGVVLPKGVTPEAAKDFLTILGKVLKGAAEDETDTLAEEEIADDAATDEVKAEGESEPISLIVDLASELSKLVKEGVKTDSGVLTAEEAATMLALLKKMDAAHFDITKTVKTQLTKATKTKDLKVVHWQGGGGFQLLRVSEPKLHTAGSHTVLADAIKDLGSFVAAQLGYTLTPDRKGVTGAKNRDVLVVVEGIVDEEQVKYAVSLAQEEETVTIAGLAVHPLANAVLAEARSGSRIVKVPGGLFKQSKVVR